MLEIQNITIEAISKEENGKLQADTLLENINLKANRGEVVLLIGPSGGGKSLLTNLLLGLISPYEPGLRITKTNKEHSCYDIILGNERLNVLADIYPSQLHGKIGIMFQALGLFDDLTVHENLAIANDQSSTPLKKQEFSAWEKDIFSNDKLKLDERVLNSELGPLSGGQRQRVAFARLLAFQPKIRILDEPTAALDPNTTDKVIDLIKKSQVQKDSMADEPGKSLLTLVITHDFENFLPVADRVWFISQDRQVHDHETPKDAKYYQEQLGENRSNRSIDLSTKDYNLHRSACADKILDTSFKRFFLSLAKGSLPKNPFWVFKFFWILFKLLVVRAVPYILLAGFFIGLVATYFSLNANMGQIQLSTTSINVEKIAKPLLFDEMLSGFGIVMFRALIPLLTCIFIASRSGTAITAYLSIMRDKDRKQWDAFTTFGIEPSLFFYPQILIIFILGCAILSYLAFFSAALGCLLIAVYTNPLCTWFTWVNTFWNNLNPVYLFGVLPIFSGFAMFIIKTVCAGAAIATISFHFGTKIRKNSLETLKYLIKSNVFNMISILVIFFILLIIEAS